VPKLNLTEGATPVTTFRPIQVVDSATKLLAPDEGVPLGVHERLVKLHMLGYGAGGVIYKAIDLRTMTVRTCCHSLLLTFGADFCVVVLPFL
jgi:hypothetical protein